MCSRTIVFDWHKQFRDGTVDISLGDPVFPSVLRALRARFRRISDAQLVLSAVAKLSADFYRDIYSEWVERHSRCIQKRMKEMRYIVSVPLINRSRHNDVPKRSMRHPTLFEYYMFRVSINSIFTIFHPAVGGVFIFHHIYLNAKVSQPFNICVFFSMVQVRIFI